MNAIPEEQTEEEIEGPWVSDKTLAAELDVHRTTIWRWAREGKIPKPKKIGPNTQRFNRSKALQALLGEGV